MDQPKKTQPQINPTFYTFLHPDLFHIWNTKKVTFSIWLSFFKRQNNITKTQHKFLYIPELKMYLTYAEEHQQYFGKHYV